MLVISHLQVNPKVKGTELSPSNSSTNRGVALLTKKVNHSKNKKKIQNKTNITFKRDNFQDVPRCY